MSRPLAIVGAGGHGAVIAESAIRSEAWRVGGFFDDAGPEAVARMPLAKSSPWLGGLADAAGHEAELILGVGDIAARARILGQLGEGPFTATVIDPSAIISQYATIGRGVFIGPRTVINARAEVRDHAIINTACVIEHDCVIGRNAHVAPGAVLCGQVTVGEGALVGAGSAVVPGVTIGAGARVGAGAAVPRDVPAGETFIGRG
jgi:UDP-perosamine 4-acetyltransferase